MAPMQSAKNKAKNRCAEVKAAKRGGVTGGGDRGRCAAEAAAAAGVYMSRAHNAISCAGFTMSNLQMKGDSPRGSSYNS